MKLLDLRMRVAPVSGGSSDRIEDATTEGREIHGFTGGYNQYMNCIAF
jgi:hypothetical protein